MRLMAFLVAAGGGLMHPVQAGFIHWEVVDGTVDLAGPGWWDLLPGNGLYVDLDGTTSDAGTMVSRQSFLFEPGREYTLQFELAGNRRHGGLDFAEVQVAFGDIFNKTYARPGAAEFQVFTEHFFVSEWRSAKLSFAGLGGDRVGLLLDDIRLSVGGVTLLTDSFDGENGGKPAANYGSLSQWDPLIYGDAGPGPGQGPGTPRLPDSAGSLGLLVMGVFGMRWFARISAS